MPDVLPYAQQRAVQALEFSGAHLERMNPCTQEPRALLVRLEKGTLRVEVNPTRIGVFHCAYFKFRHPKFILTAYGRFGRGAAAPMTECFDDARIRRHLQSGLRP